MIAVGLFFIFCVFSVDSVFKVVSKGVTPSGFSCEGRISGYYADVETGCQTYHFCEGSNRHYSYVCPNGTLFQQRMMVCFHAYMVDCRNSEKDYVANLLIGNEKEPFVKDFGQEKFIPPKTFVTNFPPKPSVTNFPPRLSVTNFSPKPPVTNFPLKPSVTNFPPRLSITNFPPKPPVTNFPPKPSVTNFPPNPSTTNFSLKPSVTNFPPRSSTTNFPPKPSAINSPPKPSVTFLPPFENPRQSKSSKDSVIKLILNDTRNLFFISNQNSSTGEDLKTVQEFIIPVENQITNFRFKKNPTVENGCPSYCHPKFLIPGTCHPCLMIK